MAEDYDLFVIGGGSGGVRAARVAAQAGFRVGLAEEDRMGGTCVIRGCVPKKLMVYASAFSEAFEDAAGFGWEVGERRFHWDRLTAALEQEVSRLEGLYRKGLLEAGVEVFDTRATLAGPHEVRLDGGRIVRARVILVATGGTPMVPDIPGAEHAITSREVFILERQPKRLLVNGGGYIACEFASIFNGLGSQVTQYYRGEQILRGFDGEVRGFVAEEMRLKGVDLHCGVNIASIEKEGEALRVIDTLGRELEVDAVLMATGRVPNTAGLGLEEVGVELTRNGAVAVDDYSRSSVPSIWAVGDVTDRVALTPVAIREAMAFVETALHGRPTQPDHAVIPTAVFTQPEVGTVGMSEEEALEAHEAEIYCTSFRPMQHILAGREERMLMKLVVDRESRRVLGCHIVGRGAGEMIQLAGVAVKMGATKEDFDRTCAVHPTAAEELVLMRTPVRVGRKES